MKTIKQLSKELQISKEAIYKKIKFQLKEPLESHITKLNHVTHIDEIGEQMIIQSLHRERQETIKEIVAADPVDAKENITNVQAGEQPHLTEYIHLLQEQVKTKDIQIDVQSTHISQLIKQLGNNQFLLQVEQYKKILCIQAETAAVKEPNLYKMKSFLSRIFKKKTNKISYKI